MLTLFWTIAEASCIVIAKKVLQDLLARRLVGRRHY